MLFKECFKIHIIEYHANQGIVFPKKSSYCKDHAIQGFVNQGPTVYNVFLYYIKREDYYIFKWNVILPFVIATINFR